MPIRRRRVHPRDVVSPNGFLQPIAGTATRAAQGLQTSTSTVTAVFPRRREVVGIVEVALPSFKRLAATGTGASGDLGEAVATGRVALRNLGEAAASGRIALRNLGETAETGTGVSLAPTESASMPREHADDPN